MKKNLLILLAIIGYLPLHGQEKIKSYVQNHTTPIKSIAPDFTDYSDLEEISKAIGEARVVMLGEQDHGDGAAFLAKTRLIKYLHEQKGFNVLAFEGDFFALNHGWDSLNKKETSMQGFLHFNTYPVWSRCKECDELLYNYIPQTYQTNSPIKIAGFDNQLYRAYSWNNLNTFIKAYLSKQEIAFTQSATYQQFFIPFLDTLRRPELFIKKTKYLISDNQTKLKRFEAAIDTILNQLQHKKEQEYEIMLFKNLKELAKENYFASKDEVMGNNVRDAQMAKNLEWLIRYKYPDEKVIVWAANAHISKGTRQTYKFQNRSINWMGSVFTQTALNNTQTYVLGFSSKTGAYRRTGAPKASVVLKPKKNSFENWIDEKHAYAFIDFKSFRKLNPTFNDFFEMKGIGHYSQPAVWTDIYDGVFYIKEMIPCGNSEFKPALSAK